MNIKYFCLNMKDAVERRQHCERSFVKAGIQVQYVDGINSKQMNVQHAVLKGGKIGCYLSFYQLYEKILRNNYGVCLVFEDDIQLSENFVARLEQSLAVLPENWDAAFIGWWPGWWNYEQLKMQAVNDTWLQITEGVVWGGYGQVINGAKGAAKVRNALANIEGHFDGQLFEAVVTGKITGYFLQKPIGILRIFFQARREDEGMRNGECGMENLKMRK